MKLAYEPHEQRVLDERMQLNNNIEKLDDFIKGARFQNVNPDEQGRLRAQLEAMQKYSGILTQRIEAFCLTPPVPLKSGTVELDNLGPDKSNW